MIDWSVPLRSKNGHTATILHEYYNGVQDMVVVSLNRDRIRSAPDGKTVEVIKVYDKRWGMDQTNGSRPSMDKDSGWDLEVIPPPDKIGYLVVWPDLVYPEKVDIISHTEKQVLPPDSLSFGQIKVVIDGRTNKVKSATVV
jgi:hypothetical protein